MMYVLLLPVSYPSSSLFLGGGGGGGGAAFHPFYKYSNKCTCMYNMEINVLNLLFQVTRALPQLSSHLERKAIRDRLSAMLAYRRNHIKNTKFWKRAKKVKDALLFTSCMHVNIVMITLNWNFFYKINTFNLIWWSISLVNVLAGRFLILACGCLLWLMANLSLPWKNTCVADSIPLALGGLHYPSSQN